MFPRPPAAHALAAALLAASAAAAPAAAQEKVAFASLDGALTGGAPTRIEGLLWRPPGVGPFPAVVLLHGCGGLHGASGRPTGRHLDWAERFRDRGWVALHVDSFTPRGVASVCATPTRQRVARATVERPYDAWAGLAWLQAQPFVRPDRVALMGWSNGGETTLQSVFPGAAAAAAAGPRPGFVAAVAFYPGCRSSLAAGGAWTTRIPLLILNGDADDWTPVGPCEELVARARAGGAPVELVVYPGAVHDFDAPNATPRVRTGIATTATGTARTGTDPAARADAIERVPAWLAVELGR